MPTRIELDPEQQVIAIYQTDAANARVDDEGPKRTPLQYIDRILFHSKLPYWRVAAHQPPVRVSIPARSGNGSANLTSATTGWPARHGVRGRGFHLIFLVGTKPRTVDQHTSGDVIPKGYSGSLGWRRMALTLTRGGVQVIDYWSGNHRAQRLYMGYVLLQRADGMPTQAVGATLYDINPGAADPYIRFGNFDTRDNWLRAVAPGAGQFVMMQGPHIYADKGATLIIANASGGFTRRSGAVPISPNAQMPKPPSRVGFRAWA